MLHLKKVKIICAITSIVLMASACQNQKKEKEKHLHQFNLTVNLSGDYPSQITLKTDDQSLEAEVINSQAVFKDTLSYAKSARIFIDDSTASQRFYLALDQLQTVNFMIDKDSIENQFFHNISAPQIIPQTEKSILRSYAAYQKDEITLKTFKDKFTSFLATHPKHQVIGEILTDMSQKNKIGFNDLKALKEKTNRFHFQKDDAELFERYYKQREKYQKGKAFYPFELESLERQQVKLNEIDAKLIFVEFWSTWAHEPMIKKQEFLDNYRFYKSKSYEVVSISLNTNREIWMQNVVESNMPWVNLLSEQGYTSDIVTEMGIYNLPQNYLIDHKGVIIAKNVNYDNLKTYQKLVLN